MSFLKKQRSQHMNNSVQECVTVQQRNWTCFEITLYTKNLCKWMLSMCLWQLFMSAFFITFFASHICVWYLNPVLKKSKTKSSFFSIYAYGILNYGFALLELSFMCAISYLVYQVICNFFYASMLIYTTDKGITPSENPLVMGKGKYYITLNNTWRNTVF